ncbi:hypothetical protein QWY14_14455 [Planococcus sp. N028]|uniref:Uncharacterized protein n=1 Tax=Planococcus shixiaomingii TaxID=3058393 RepID=A0ABT8N557_9BACL|nr:hypothetical protein [Planococcus sp. N028]MDN7243014.1 hypothetical protein [Planococcus sp. N028]
MMVLNTIISSLEAKDYITISGLLITAVISLATLILTSRSNKKNLYMNSVTKERVTSMSELKEQVARYISTISNYNIINEYNEDEINLILKENEYRALRIMLQLNPDKSEEEDLYKEITKINSLIKYKHKIFDDEKRANNPKDLLKLIEVQNINISSFYENYFDELGNISAQQLNQKILVKFEEKYKHILGNLLANLISKIRIHLKKEWGKVKKESK